VMPPVNGGFGSVVAASVGSIAQVVASPQKHDLKAVRPFFFTMCGSSDYHTSPLV